MTRPDTEYRVDAVYGPDAKTVHVGQFVADNGKQARLFALIYGKQIPEGAMLHACPWRKIEESSPDLSISDEQINQLQLEACAHGDSDMSIACEEALDGDSDARNRCAEFITDARAMENT